MQETCLVIHSKILLKAVIMQFFGEKMVNTADESTNFIYKTVFCIRLHPDTQVFRRIVIVNLKIGLSSYLLTTEKRI